ncbi:hypothetical protein AB0D49_17790 [Streptomyces sp. NPDC048290]|uniref:hypothetical protein n=1 Tax=Streptomyces sp. NPDC048290 TaxID=3155811 RepID=UPI003413CACB
MHRPGIRHPRLRTPALTLTATLSLALLTACGGSGDGSGGGSGGGDGKEAAPAADVKPLTAAELEKASLVTADLEGYKVVEAPDSDIRDVEAVKVTGEECTPVGRAVAGSALGEADAVTYRRVTGGDRGDGAGSEADLMNMNTGMATLASYASADAAAEALKSLTGAIADCSGGFEWTVGSEKLTANKVTEDTAPDGGEEAVAFTVLATVEGVDAPWKAVVFRDGATLAHFTLVNVAAIGTGEDFTFPAALVTAQAQKLGG